MKNLKEELVNKVISNYIYKLEQQAKEHYAQEVGAININKPIEAGVHNIIAKIYDEAQINLQGMMTDIKRLHNIENKNIQKNG